MHDERFLEAGLAQMRGLAPLNPAAVAAVKALLATGSDEEVRRINALELAAHRDVPLQPMLDALVAAAKVGLLEFAWDLTCPLCGMFAHRAPRLQTVSPEMYCKVCDYRAHTTLDSIIEVTFRPSPKLRAIPEDPVSFDSMRNPAAQVDPAAAEIRMARTLWLGTVEPGASEGAPVALDERKIRAVVASHDALLVLELPPGVHGAELALTDAGLVLEKTTAAPGLRLTNRTATQALGIVARMTDEEAKSDRLRPFIKGFDPFLSGKTLMCNQMFRDLFGRETLSAGIALHVEKLTLLFTDLKGSTALYDALGDVRAFTLVSEHFKILLSAVKDRGGAVVKTIGDAVMASFPTAEAAMEAALQMNDQLAAFNQSSKLPPLSLKIGMHTGACIVVSSNERLDYFGQTVNVAARVQGLAEGDETIVSDAAWAAGAGKIAEAHHRSATVSAAALKGVAEQVRVHTLR